jgi:hypothetical protein
MPEKSEASSSGGTGSLDSTSRESLDASVVLGDAFSRAWTAAMKTSIRAATPSPTPTIQPGLTFCHAEVVASSSGAMVMFGTDPGEGPGTLSLGEGEGNGEPEGVTEGEAEGVSLAEGATYAGRSVPVGAGEDESDGAVAYCGAAETHGDADGVEEGDAPSDTDGVPDGVREAVGVRDGVRDGVRVGVPVAVGVRVCDGMQGGISGDVPTSGMAGWNWE